jgi:hypothetical protein
MTINQLAAALHPIHIVLLSQLVMQTPETVAYTAVNTVPCPQSSFEDRHSGAKKLVSLAPNHNKSLIHTAHETKDATCVSLRGDQPRPLVDQEHHKLGLRYLDIWEAVKHCSRGEHVSFSNQHSAVLQPAELRTSCTRCHEFFRSVSRSHRPPRLIGARKSDFDWAIFPKAGSVSAGEIAARA